MLVLCAKCRRPTEEMSGAVADRAYCSSCDLVFELESTVAPAKPAPPKRRGGKRRRSGAARAERAVPPSAGDPWATRKDLQ